MQPLNIALAARRAALLAATSLLCGIAHPAIAQTEAKGQELGSVTVTDTPIDDAEAETSYKASRSISATKTDTPLIDVPQSVSVVTVRNIEDRAANGIGEAILYVPGVTTSQGENNRETLVFRGNSTTGDFFVDGVRDDVQTYRDLYNIERLEIFKGPNAMIFGRGGIGGIVNRVTKQADWTSGRQARIEGGSHSYIRITGDINQPLGEMAAVRLTGVFQDSGSFRDDGRFDRWGVNPTATFRLGSSTTFFLGYEHFQDDRTAERGIPSEARINGITATQVIGPFETRRLTVFGDPDNSPTNTNTDAVTGAIEHRFSDAVVLRSRLRYADYDKFYQNVFPGLINAAARTNPAGLPAGVYAPGTIVEISAYNNAQRRKNLFSQTDFNAEFATGSIKHTLLVGLELGRQTTDNVRFEGFFPTPGNASGVQTIFARVDAPNIRPDIVWRQTASSGDNYSVAKVVGVYAQDQIEFSPWLQAIVGIRYDHFNVKLTNRNALLAPGTQRDFETTDNLWSPRFGLILKPVENASIYAAYSRTYQPRAGDQLASLNVTSAVLAPEKFDNYELGVKWDVLPDLNVSAAVYQLDRSNVIVLKDPNNPGAGTELGGGQRSRGFELGIAGNITEHLSVMGAYTYTDAKFTRAISASVQPGAELANVPKHAASLWSRYDIGKFGIGVGVIHQGSRFAATDNLVKLPSFTRFDGALYYNFSDTLQAQVNVENLFDEKYFLNANSNTNLSPGSPTAFKVGLSARF